MGDTLTSVLLKVSGGGSSTAVATWGQNLYIEADTRGPKILNLSNGALFYKPPVLLFKVAKGYFKQGLIGKAHVHVYSQPVFL